MDGLAVRRKRQVDSRFPKRKVPLSDDEPGTLARRSLSEEEVQPAASEPE
jgi:hypothetical protein